jgi:hypothetical protein
VLPSDADARAYVLAVNTADGQPLEAPVVQAIDAFVIGCKADGIWSAIKASCILCGARTLAGALTPLVGPAPTNNGPFVAADYVRGGATPGLIGNGSTKFLASNRASNADPQNDFHMGCWVSVLPTNLTTTNPNYMGTITAAFTLMYNLGSATPRDGTGCRSSGTGAYTNTEPVVAGFRGIARASSTTFTHRVNNVTNTNTDTSAAPSSSDLNVFALSGTTGNRNNGRFSFYSIGTSLNLALLNSRVSTLVAAMANVT